jgi:prepilin-type N-terminal cleavage/methylation domain-containing protein
LKIIENKNILIAEKEAQMKHKNGFTLIEMVVVLAVVAILAAILTPTIAKNIRDAKISRGNNEVQVMAAAMATFYKDTGRWPTSNGAGTNDALYILNGPSTANNMNPGGYTAYWGLGATWAAQKDFLENHLVRNAPGVAGTPGAVPYSTSGEFKWNGPYLDSISPDPWGTVYSCNIISFWYTGGNYKNYAIYILSAGPDKVADTSYAQDITNTTTMPALGGDDVGKRLK